MELVVALFLGGMISWAIAHEYYRYSRKEDELITKTVLVRRNIEDVWQFVSDPSNFTYTHYHRAESFDNSNIAEGSTFSGISNSGKRMKLFVTKWLPPSEFSWGYSPQEWSTQIRLRDIGENTELCLTRRFSPLVDPWWYVLFEKLHIVARDQTPSIDELTSTVVRKIKDRLEQDR